MSLLSALVTYLLLSLALAGCLAQFVLLKREIWKLQKKAEEERSGLLATVAQLEGRLNQLQDGVEAQACFAGTAVGEGMNFSKRSRVLRMHRRGDRPDQIAATLALPQNEVDLVLKVQQITITPPPQS